MTRIVIVDKHTALVRVLYGDYGRSRFSIDVVLSLLTGRIPPGGVGLQCPCAYCPGRKVVVKWKIDFA